MRYESIAFVAVAGVALSTAAPAQLCSIPCNGTQVVCHHQNGIRNLVGIPATGSLIAGPNAATGNVPGDAEWKIWAVENGMTRGSGVHRVTNWEIGAGNSGPATASVDIPNMELRPVVLGAGVKEPDMAAAPIDSFVVGSISLPTGFFRINVSLLQGVAAPALCLPPTGLPTLSNADVAMLFLYTPGQVIGMPAYYQNLVTTTEVNTVSNPSVPPTGTGNSYSGTFDAALNQVTHYPINQELFAEMGFFEPTLEAYRQTTGFPAPTRGSGARELAPGDTVLLRVEDWQAGTDAIAGQDRLSAFLISDNSAGSPVGQAPPGGGPGFFPGSALLPGSTGIVPLYVTPLLSGQLLVFTGRMGVGLSCPIVGDVACTAAGVPSVFTDLQASTPAILVPPGLTGVTLYVAAFNVNLTTLTIPEGTNVVELLFL
ncbi:MAG TPA: hypothetical protein VFI25_15825 [Planctomycetota bacterium]|jgi:hypothetical protein|nr:hypothetical protein [Planctomycetota bacterium]